MSDNSESNGHKACKLDTRYVSCEADPTTGAIVPPLHLSTTYERDEHGDISRGFIYSRIGNPTRQQFEEILTKLEGGLESFAFSSGMQAATAMLMACPGSHVILPDDLYHGVYQVTVEILSLWGLTYDRVDMTNHEVVEQTLRNAGARGDPDNKVILWMESPSNPQCKISDTQTLSELARSIVGADRAVVVVDSTWITPYLVNPLALGADFVLHSVTKYICGHSDVLGGSLTVSKIVRHAEVLKRVRTVQQIGGGVLGPHESWMAMRGLRTLPVRMKQHCETAMELATRLEAHPLVDKVFYPGLQSHPQHELAARTMREGRFGGMMSILVKQTAGEDSDKEALSVSIVPVDMHVARICDEATPTNVKMEPNDNLREQSLMAKMPLITKSMLRVCNICYDDYWYTFSRP